MQSGILNKQNLSDCHVTLDNLLGQLRLKGAANLSEIDSLVLEPTGKISVIKKPEFLPVNRKQMNLPPKYAGLPAILIYDGQVQQRSLALLDSPFVPFSSASSSGRKEKYCHTGRVASLLVMTSPFSG